MASLEMDGAYLMTRIRILKLSPRAALLVLAASTVLSAVGLSTTIATGPWWLITFFSVGVVVSVAGVVAASSNLAFERKSGRTS